jgi:hypothetical protein
MSTCASCTRALTLRAPQRLARRGEINGDALDRFTLVHFGAGVTLGLLRTPWWLAIPMAIGWEIVENRLKDRFPEMFPHATHDTLPNAVMDALAMTTGWAAARLLT